MVNELRIRRSTLGPLHTGRTKNLPLLSERPVWNELASLDHFLILNLYIVRSGIKCGGYRLELKWFVSVSATGSQFRSLEATRSIKYASIYHIVGKLGAIYSNYGTCVHCASVP